MAFKFFVRFCFAALLALRLWNQWAPVRFAAFLELDLFLRLLVPRAPWVIAGDLGGMKNRNNR